MTYKFPWRCPFCHHDQPHEQRCPCKYTVLEAFALRDEWADDFTDWVEAPDLAHVTLAEAFKAGWSIGRRRNGA